MSTSPASDRKTTLAAGSVVLTAGQLANLIKPVLPFAATGRDLPTLAAVHLVVRGAYLLAETTDRYRLAITRHRLERPVPQFECLLPTRDARHMVNLFRGPRGRGQDVVLRLTVSSGGLNVAAADGLEEFVGASWTYRLEESWYPDVAHLIAEALDRCDESQTARTVHLNGSYLGDWRHIITDGASPLSLSAPDPLKPVVIRYGVDFIGIQMPVRRDPHAEYDEAAYRASWAPLLPSAKRAAASPADESTEASA